MTRSGPPMAYTDRIAELAGARGGQVAVVLVDADGAERRLSWVDLLAGLERAAAELLRRGVRPGDLVAVVLPKCPEHFAFLMGAWRIGARPLTVNPAMPVPERRRLLAVARPRLVVSTGPGAGDVLVRPGAGWDAAPGDGAPLLPPPPLEASFAIGTGGSSGVPKVILSPFPGAFVDTGDPPDAALTGRTADMVQLVNGPLFHNSPCTLAYGGLLWGHTLVVMERFAAAPALELIERHRVSFLPTVPTVMKRLLDSPELEATDLGSVRALFHTGASCPPQVKQAWIDLLGPTRVFEAFGGSELVGTTFVRGDEWLAHRGTVGRPVGADLRILSDDGSELPPGTIGEIYMRRHDTGPGFRYAGDAAPRRVVDGFESLGDLGHVDAEGYLYVADRRVDVIITGGENVYPAEVENALLEHPGVRDAVVIGLPDPDWGSRVHAVLELAGAPVPTVELVAHCRTRLSAYKVPKGFEVVAALPRDEAGKVRRSAMAAARREG
ncbi:MAG TPA: AMP-binding protein [Mycobacteriales bacterium]|jgi:bile acid-coenzyme A ligase|nr:AMP-binding protein [Mycobacteriales bacterium]